ncbi:MAG: hypothetical protein M1832_006263 [Thelocarpon impressellum]|nr:MAG: hypothetical protein M1832_006263 [Thelocarpon impressellum]
MGGLGRVRAGPAGAARLASVAAGCWLLAAGCWLLAAGCWLLVLVLLVLVLLVLVLVAVGCWLLAGPADARATWQASLAVPAAGG